jgi:hypothetical protein
MSGYPAGEEHNPDAPYNQIDCDVCEGTGMNHCVCENCDGSCVCTECNGTGVQSEQNAQDRYESFKEDTRDE